MGDTKKENTQKIRKSLEKRLEIWNKAIAGDTKALIEATIMMGMAKREDFPELDIPEEK